MEDNVPTGQCMCGMIKFRVKGEPNWVGHCHCDSCRRSTGAAVATFVGFHIDAVKYTHGKRQIYNSSPGVSRGFCGNCGTPLSYESEKFPDEIHLYVCTLNNPEIYHAQFHVFYDERIPWFELNDTLPRHEGTLE